MLQLKREDCSYTYPPLSIARYSTIQLNELEQCRVKKLAQCFITAAQDSNPGSLSRESEALPLSHCALQQTLARTWVERRTAPVPGCSPSSATAPGGLAAVYTLQTWHEALSLPWKQKTSMLSIVRSLSIIYFTYLLSCTCFYTNFTQYPCSFVINIPFILIIIFSCNLFMIYYYYFYTYFYVLSFILTNLIILNLRK